MFKEKKSKIKEVNKFLQRRFFVVVIIMASFHFERPLVFSTLRKVLLLILRQSLS